MDYSSFTRLKYGIAGIIASTALFGCADKTTKPETPPVAAAPAAEAPKPPVAAKKPDAIEGELIVLKATVKAINKKKRIVTLLDENGKQFQVTCGPEIENFSQIRIGDKVTTQFLESVEIEVTASKTAPHADQSETVERAPKGNKPELLVVDKVEVYATVQSIDYNTRQVTLLGPEGKVLKVKAGPNVERFNEIKVNDTVIARLTEAVDVKVEAPAKASK
ncbi:hypothetical protein F6R98_20760 [Candidatus Methylospira mobilis]|uniref:DUF5666 domain-containing protein n=1 Tax=Candidatus Methylospira mobilis TaxID=1808979 RepID=A0A5Q0BMC3_9GAMM|nr:hypothetical protein [Candidatus Methylospira mobilis]QFY44759.1 hypothetical protein F6R98_20760 [Candidatus Methylospira mobilis]WNV05702.1 hypothetical protein RP726_04595 [Candidatus Methylospira mobilis]